ncbi:MAG: COX15/CtaA family protein [Ornithinimicrobium sp.]|uniref:COX15/CtaA family protein n=1 Tax=Ornithinimicrobium sp. TaxID=1977084 RepID=UPI003D9B7D93
MPTSPWLSRILTVNLVMQVLIVVTGGLVRLTGSGLGCPSWPQCEPGSYTPTFQTADGIHPYIEFGNRMVGILVGVVALATLVAVLRWGRSRPLPLLAGLVLVGPLAQGVLGGITVRTGLHPATVMAHFLISMALVGTSTLLVWQVRAGWRPPARAFAVGPGALVARRLGMATAAVAAVVLVLGTMVTGAGPHSGDAGDPARLGLDPRTLSWLHADSVMIFCGLVIAMLITTHLVPALAPSRRPWEVVLGVTVAQGLVGYLQYALGLPVALVSLHMLGATLLTLALTWALRSLLATTCSDQRQVQQRVERHREEDQREIADREVEQPHRAQL